jgi:hypothetical protein
VTISAAGVFTVSGAVMFTRMPNGQVNVDMPQAAVTISDAQQLRRTAGGLRHLGRRPLPFRRPAGLPARGHPGQRLFDLRTVGATIAAPAATLRAPTADLANPTSTSIVSINDLTYLAVTYQDPNRAGMNEASILDAAAEFSLSVSDHALGNTISGLTVDNAAVQKFVDATNDRTFLYPLLMTQAFKDALALPANSKGVTVTVTFVNATWSDQRGANGAAEVERFTVYARAAPGTAAPTAQPYATLASPANGATASLQTLNAQRYLDITFFSPTGAALDVSAASTATNCGSAAPVPPTSARTPTARSWRP